MAERESNEKAQCKARAAAFGWTAWNRLQRLIDAPAVILGKGPKILFLQSFNAVFAMRLTRY
ncbi:MAG: hypothetical protein E6K53_07060 [Gammaproteobacteria bacterium]|nr:MAG: hypothetical protein E6K53_07060 [Gammaproteobacteria bacterium]